MSLNEKIIKIRVALQESNLKKSGENTFQHFSYFELADFLPTLNKLMLENGVNDLYTIEDGKAILILNDVESEERQIYTMPFKFFDTPLNYKKNKATGEIERVKSMQDIQYLGALNTYYKRYLYVNAFGITDGEIIDGMNNNDTVPEVQKENKATPKQVSMLNLLNDQSINNLLEKYQVKTVEELSVTQASEAIGKIMEKQKEKSEGK